MSDKMTPIATVVERGADRWTVRLTYRPALNPLEPGTDRITELERRVRALEDALYGRREVVPAPALPFAPAGCACPAGAEAGCRGALCPRQPWKVTA